MQKQIIELFKRRDLAVKEKNKEAFLSTQTHAIQKSESQEYLKLDKMNSMVLHIHEDDKNPKTSIALVKEEYFFDNRFSHSNYLMYKIKNTNNTPLIFEIAW